MSLIFYLSSLSGLPDFQSFDLAAKKIAHFSVYALLYLLFFRAFQSVRPKVGPSSSRIYAFAAVATVLYAISDEIHQFFVPFRNATIVDVVIDSFGVLVMYVLLRRKLKWFRPVLGGSSLE
jgi:VanZ family protein